ncbi:MAG: YceD family protein [Fusicatenibacter sp.]|nr:DUF177 domain-containing protein [Fusicatenibacter sp.]
MKISLTRLLAQEGKLENHEVSLDLDTVQIGEDSFEIIEKHPVVLELVHKGSHVITITGHTELIAAIPCARCLTPVSTPFSIEFDREIELNLSEEEREEKEEDSGFIEGDSLNVEGLVRNELLIQWPIRVLCKDDCKGICSRCGANLNNQTCDCDTTELDPRMAAIRDIFSKFKEV